jgi:hypothetical protein
LYLIILFFPNSFFIHIRCLLLHMSDLTFWQCFLQFSLESFIIPSHV